MLSTSANWLNQLDEVLSQMVSSIIPYSLISDALANASIIITSPITFLKAGFASDDLVHLISFKDKPTQTIKT